MHLTSIVLLLCLSQAAGGRASADEHLLAGAGAFREGRLKEALVEFRVAQKLGAREAAGYVGATLVKLERAEDAVEAFGSDEPQSPDALLDYYRAMAFYGVRLFVSADRLLASVGERAGPRVGEQAAKVRAAIAAELAKEPPPEAIDWYLAQCGAKAKASRPLLAAAFCREASELARRRRDGYRRAEAEASLVRLADSAGRGASP